MTPAKAVLFSERRNAKSLEKRLEDETLVVREAMHGYAMAKTVERAFTCLGLLSILVGLVVGLLSTAPIYASALENSVLSGAGLVITGFMLFAFGTRGSRRQLTVDADHKKIEFGRINSSNLCRISNVVQFTEIESVYVQRSADHSGKFCLMLSTCHRRAPYTVLTGHEGDLRDLHEDICRVVKPVSFANRHQPTVARLFEQLAAAG
ncbi:hypothetical protein [Roseovarius sp.]|uniref:hypothetical protein n=1 Tax=Roseovarius sp. TaxID=1486281 RepID=UPI002625BCCC|nr:hypothetical protein [Roseovarius sp.]